jgi:hypothetical protein
VINYREFTLKSPLSHCAETSKYYYSYALIQAERVRVELVRSRRPVRVNLPGSQALLFLAWVQNTKQVCSSSLELRKRWTR